MIKKYKKKLNIKLYQIIIFIIVLLALSYFYFYSEGGFKENIVMKAQIAELEMELVQLKQQNSELEKEIIKIKKDPNYIVEKVAREELHMKKSNEKVIYLDETGNDN
ncbi:septum formation initiator family protein [bacterium]|nr:septum formation initiator family protein [bacterium]